MIDRNRLLSPLVTTLPHLTWPLDPYDDESLAGFTGRHCAYNALRNPLVVINDAGLLLKRGYGYLPRASGDLDELATILGIGTEWAESRRHRSVEGKHGGPGNIVDFHGAKLRRVHMDYKIRRVAPSLVRKTLYHREIWHVYTLAASMPSGEMLVERCPAVDCGRELDWNETRGIGCCSDADCPGDLSQLHALQIPAEQLAAITVAAAIIDPDPMVAETALARLPEGLRNENRGDLFELAWLLGCLDRADGSEAAVDPQRLSAASRTDVLSRGITRLQEWPVSLWSTFRGAAESEPTGVDVQRMVKVVRLIARRKTTFGRAAALIAEELKGLLDKGYTTLLARQLGRLTGREFADATGLWPSQMASVQRSGCLERLLFSEGTRDIALFNPGDVDDVRTRLRARLSARTFATETGLGIDAVELLVASDDLLQIEDPIIQTLWAEQHVDLDAANCLRVELENGLITGTAPEDAVPLFRALWASKPGEKPWPSIIRAILSGRLKLYRHRRRNLDVRSCYIDPDGMRFVRSLTAPDKLPTVRSEWLSDADARERLSTTSKWLRELAKTGRLTSSGNFHGKTYARASVNALVAKNASLHEVGAKLNVTHWELRPILLRAGLTADAQYFLPRDEAREKLGLATL